MTSQRGRAVGCKRTCSFSVRECLARLNKLGYPAEKGSVIISSHVTADFLKRNRAGKSVYLVGNHNLTKDFKEAGIPLTENDPDIVVVGFDTELTYEKLDKAANFIAKGAEYITTHPDVNETQILFAERGLSERI